MMICNTLLIFVECRVVPHAVCPESTVIQRLLLSEVTLSQKENVDPSLADSGMQLIRQIQGHPRDRSG